LALALAVAGCGGDDDDDEEAAPPPPPAATGGTRLVNPADSGGQLAFEKDELTAPAGEVTLEEGEYTFYCSVPGHEAGGMEGTLTVTSG
jgi:hypothetical protein